jgi:anti-sigma B factor antagonist
LTVADQVPCSLVVSRVFGSVVVSVAGDLDLHTAPQLRRLLAEVVEQPGNLAVVVDLSGVTFVDSAGLGVLLGAHKALRQRAGELTLSAPPRPVLQAIEASRLSEVFTITRA